MGCSFIASIQSAIGDVVDVAAPIVAAIPGPWQIPAMVVLAANTVENGGDLGDVIKAVGMSYLAGEIGGAVGAAGDSAAAAATYGTELGSAQSAMLAAQEAGLGTVGDIAGNIAGGVARSTVLGGDPLTALVTGGIGAGVGELTAQIPGFSGMPAAAQNAIKSAMTAELQGKDPSQALMSGALTAGLNAAKDFNPSTSSNLPTDTSGYPVQDFGAGNSTQYLDEYQKNLQDLTDAGGYTSQWVPDEAGNHTLTNDDGSTITLDASGAVTNVTNSTDTPFTGSVSPSKLSGLAGALASTTGLSGTGATGGGGAAGALPTVMDPTAPWGGYKTAGTAGYDNPDVALDQIYSGLTAAPEIKYDAPVYAATSQQNMAPLQNMYQPQGSYYAPNQFFAEGGEVTDSTRTAQQDQLAYGLKSLGALDSGLKMPQHNLRQIQQMGGQYSPKVLPQLAALLRSRGMNFADGGRPDDHEHPNYDGTPVFRTGGLDGLGGKYVEGKGDGTSDDISAMLANGEYVFSADVVSALGNGSNKAGADKLGEMVEAIRARARSAPPDKLPPDAKSPLEYLKSPKGKKNG